MTYEVWLVLVFWCKSECVCLSVYLSVRLSVCPSVCLSVCLSACLSVRSQNIVKRQ